MDDPFDFPIDFENISFMQIPISDIVENQAAQEISFYEETAQEVSLYEETKLNGKKIYHCTAPDCGKVFRFQSEINRHSIIHNRSRPFPCTAEGCNKSFKRADTLENHMRLHSNTLPFPCEVPGCDRRFVSKSALRYHEIRHANNRVFKCEFSGCGKSFLVATQLKQHQKAFPSHCKTEDGVDTHEQKPPSQVQVPQTVESPVETAESIQWEMQSQDLQENRSDEEVKKNFEKMFNYILNENKILKEQLRNKSKEPKEVFNLSQSAQVSLLDVKESNSSYFRSDELRFLEFLKDKGDDSF